MEMYCLRIWIFSLHVECMPWLRSHGSVGVIFWLIQTIIIWPIGNSHRLYVEHWIFIPRWSDEKTVTLLKNKWTYLIPIQDRWMGMNNVNFKPDTYALCGRIWRHDVPFFRQLQCFSSMLTYLVRKTRFNLAKPWFSFWWKTDLNSFRFLVGKLKKCKFTWFAK